MVYPVFLDSTLLGFAVNIAHHIDTGGAGAGSQAITGILDNYQEGLRIPPTKLYVAGEPVRDLFRMIEANVRVPEVLGDIRAQYTANVSAARRLQDLGRLYGPAVLAQAMRDLIVRSEAEMRTALAGLRPGTYRFEDQLDDVGPDTEPVRACVAVTISDGDIVVDWEGSGPQREAGMNSYLNYTTAYCIAAIKSVTLPTVPQNHGIIKTIKVKAPLGSFFNPRRPAACGGRAVVSHRIYEVVMGALAQAVPDRVIAATAHFYNPNIGGVDPRSGRPFICWESIIGGVGARANKDGIEATSSPWNGTNVPVEIQESRNPVMIERFGLIPDSAGPGRFRGGCGVRRDLRLLADDTVFFNLGDRNVTQPYGLFGGSPGAVGATMLNPDTSDAKPLHSKGTYRLRSGDLISWRTSGAGGYGPATERDPARVLHDVQEGLVTPARAARDYKVVVDADAQSVDAAATDQLRSR
jgi:N-methylhydantoinase B